MATLGIEEITENAIRAVARDCGSLSIECSDVAGYVEGVAERIGEHLKMLDSLEDVTNRLLTDQARVADSTDEARLLSEQAKAKLEAGREAMRRVGLRSLAGWTSGERLAWQRWSPLILTLPGLSRWSAANKRALARIVRAKGGISEIDFLARFKAHPLLGRALFDTR